MNSQILNFNLWKISAGRIKIIEISHGSLKTFFNLFSQYRCIWLCYYFKHFTSSFHSEKHTKVRRYFIHSFQGINRKRGPNPECLQQIEYYCFHRAHKNKLYNTTFRCTSNETLPKSFRLSYRRETWKITTSQNAKVVSARKWINIHFRIRNFPLFESR